MKRQRALLFFLTVVFALCVACALWLDQEQQQYARNRQLIDALVHKDTKTALVLVNAGADPNTRQNPAPPPFLFQLLKPLLHHSPPPDTDSSTALMLACIVNAKMANGHLVASDFAESQLSLLQTMLSHGANVNARTDALGTALNYAALIQNPRIVELLLQHGADANVVDGQGMTPLLVAAGSDSTQEVSLLLAHSANPNTQDPDGHAALHHALFSPNAKDIIPDLLAHGANPNLPDKKGTTPLQYAQRAQRSDLVRLLKQHSAK